MTDEIKADQEADQSELRSERVKQLEAKLRVVMKERSEIETAIQGAKQQEQALHKRASEIYAAEGGLRKQIGDLKDAHAAAGE